jgi:Uma2 family endonuclease
MTQVTAIKTLAKWSIDDYHRMIEAGILHDRQVELLGGEIVEMSPETPLHYTTAKRGAKYLEELLSGKAEVRFNGPITLSDSEPEPDIAMVRSPEVAYWDHHPSPEEIYWLIEIAHTSLKRDLEIKLALYAAAGIREYWILDLSAKQLLVFRNPQGGTYLENDVMREGSIAPLADVSVEVRRLLP